jgi:serine/threonine-protein kinase
VTDLQPFVREILADRYRIERELGAGGMATVFLANDEKHDRKVAIKVLKPELAAVLGAERFLSEIRVTANLQHPNLLPLFDSGEANGLLYYVMPYVEGETLRRRIDREKQLPTDEAVRIAVAVANALAYAHAHGVIHRDLKPENILLQAGQPVVADFGIALAVSNAGGTRVTQTGLSLGTPQYMSPEQATGDRAIDGRTDIYSLAAVTYEMLTGEPPHTGTTAQAIIARLMTERPRPIRATRETVPEHVELAISTALAKLPADRFPTASEFARALQQRTELTSGVPVPHGTSSASVPRPGARATLAWRLAPLLVAAAGAAAAAVAWLRPVHPPRVSTFVVTMPDSGRLGELDAGNHVGVSRDGSQLAYVGASGGGVNAIYVRALSDTVVRLVRGTERTASPTFSPDGAWLLFSADGKLKKVPVGGGSPIVVADSAGAAADWSDRNEILYARSGKLWRVSADGGAPSLVAQPDASNGQMSIATPHALPGGGAALVTIYPGAMPSMANARLGVVTLANGKLIALGEAGSSPRYTRAGGGQVVFARSGSLFAAPFSLRRTRLTGPAVHVMDGISNRGTGLELALADDGTMAYVSGAVGSPSRLVAVDRRGIERPITDKPNYFSWPRVSPDGKRIAVEIGTGTGIFDVWLYDVASTAWSRLTNNFSGIRPTGWSSDGRRVVYLAVETKTPASVSAEVPRTAGLAANRHVASIPWDLSGPPEGVTAESPPVPPEDASVGPPHSVVAVRLGGYTRDGDIAIAPLDSPKAMRAFVATPADEETPRLSPDGKLLAYASDETGRYEVYLRPVAGAGGRLQISAGGGSEPAWAPGGHAIYYRAPRRLMLATLTTGTELAVAKRDTLFADVYRKENKSVGYDVFPNGELLMQKLEDQSGGRLMVVLNWPELLRRRPQ